MLHHFPVAGDDNRYRQVPFTSNLPSTITVRHFQHIHCNGLIDDVLQTLDDIMHKHDFRRAVVFQFRRRNAVNNYTRTVAYIFALDDRIALDHLLALLPRIIFVVINRHCIHRFAWIVITANDFTRDHILISQYANDRARLCQRRIIVDDGPAEVQSIDDPRAQSSAAQIIDA